MPLINFYRHKQMLDGHLNICKACTKKRVGKHRDENIESIREYDKKRGRTEHRMARVRAYAQTDNGRAARIKANNIYRDKYPKRYIAKNKVSSAIRSGKLKSSPCEICGDKAEAHHDDYNKPLEIRWLCDKHHKAWHRENEAID